MDDNGCQINLDEGEGQIQNGSVVDNIHACCSFMILTFDCIEPIVLNSNPNHYFRYLGLDWVALSCSVTTNEQTNAWEYTVSCFPRCMFNVITTPIINTAQLASELGLQLYEKSVNLDLPSSHINVLSGNFIQDNRFYSFEKSFQKNNNFTEAIYLYTNGKTLYSNTWKEIVSQVATEIPEDSLSGSTVYTFQDYQMYNRYKSRYAPEKLEQKDYYYSMFGPQFKLNTSIDIQFFSTYTMKAGNISEFNVNESFLCTSVMRDLMNPTGYETCLSMIYVE